MKRLRFGSIGEGELLDIYHTHKDSYRVLFHLVQHPEFPERFSLNIIPNLFSMDLVRVIKNHRTRPYVRKRAELEFTGRYQRLPLGEKISLLKVAPHSLLFYFIEERDPRILKIILHNTQCTEDLVMRFLNRESPRFSFYEALGESDWFKRPQVAERVALDKQAPIKILLHIIPYLSPSELWALYRREDTHDIVKRNIVIFMSRRRETEE